MSKVRGRFAVSVVVASLFVAACSGSSNSDADTTNPADVAVTSAAAAATTVAAEVADTEAPEVTDTEAPAVTEAVEELTASDIGVTAEKISIAVAVADLEAVRAAGISLPETLTTDHLFRRMTVYSDRWNAQGGINGRQIEFVKVVWDPLDPTSFDALCAEATLDNELFTMINNNGLTATSMQCLVDTGMPILYGDVTTPELLETGLVMTTSAPATVNAVAGVQAWAATADVPAGSKIGVLASNSPLIKASGAAAAEALTELGFEPLVVETNSLGGDNAATVGEGAAAAGTFAAEGAMHAFVTTPFTENSGFWEAAAGQLPYTQLDTASSACAAFGVSRAPAASSGSFCVTPQDHATVEVGGITSIRADTPFEAECRGVWDESFSEYFGGASMPGVPSGQKPLDVNGKEFISDYDPGYCSLLEILHRTLSASGTNPTRESFTKALFSLGEVDLANSSNGVGFLSPDKPYAATQVHSIRLQSADATTQPDAGGLYNGCAVPVNCAVVVSDWIDIEG